MHVETELALAVAVEAVCFSLQEAVYGAEVALIARDPVSGDASAAVLHVNEDARVLGVVVVGVPLQEVAV